MSKESSSLKRPPEPRTKGPSKTLSSSYDAPANNSGTDRKTTLTIAILLAALSAGYALYRHTALPHDAGRIATPQLPESYALCTAEEGRVYTVELDNPKTDCLLVSRDRVLGTGTRDAINILWDAYQNETIRKFYGNEPKAKKALVTYQTNPGHIIVPGLADAHGHLIKHGFKVQLPLDSAMSKEDVLDLLEAYVKSHPEHLGDKDLWIRGMGWDQTRWKDGKGEFPTAADFASRPVLASRLISLIRVDGHALWVSSRAMELALDDLPQHQWPDDVEGGEIERDVNGRPNGVFVDMAMTLIPSPPFTDDEMEQYALRAFSDALSVGLTSVHDASSMDSRMLDVFKRLADEGSLSIRVYAMVSHDTPSEERLEHYGEHGRLDAKSVKLFSDGALGSWGAALLEPYSDKPDTSGLMRVSESQLAEEMRHVWNEGWGVNIHCIGDRANKAALDVFEQLLTEESDDPLSKAAERRPRIEHAQIMRVEDLERTGRLGVIASVQPTHATSDMWYAEIRLGPQRIKGAYAYQTLLQASPNKILPLGSDFPIEGINPLLGFYAAVSRLDVHGKSPHGASGWYVSEGLTRAQALKGMTLDAAYASFAESDLGSLAAGKKADLVILNQDIMDEKTVPLDRILDTKIVATVLDGRVAFGGI